MLLENVTSENLKKEERRKHQVFNWQSMISPFQGLLNVSALHTGTSSFFTTIQLECVAVTCLYSQYVAPLIRLLSLQMKYSGERSSTVHGSVNVQPAVTAFISCYKNRALSWPHYCRKRIMHMCINECESRTCQSSSCLALHVSETKADQMLNQEPFKG